MSPSPSPEETGPRGEQRGNRREGMYRPRDWVPLYRDRIPEEGLVQCDNFLQNEKGLAGLAKS